MLHFSTSFETTMCLVTKRYGWMDLEDSIVAQEHIILDKQSLLSLKTSFTSNVLPNLFWLETVT